MSELGDHMRERREALGLTKAEAARRAGISRGTWIDMEKGLRPRPAAKTMRGIEQVMGWKPRTFDEPHAQALVDHDVFNHPQLGFPAMAVVMGAMLWHVEPNDPVKVDLLHAACSFLAARMHEVANGG